MKSLFARTRQISAKAASLAILAWPATCVLIGAAGEPHVRVVQGSGAVEVQAVTPNIVRIHFQPNGQVTPRTLTMDPALQPAGTEAVRVETDGGVQTLRSPEMKVVVNGATPVSVEVQDASGKTLLVLRDDPVGRGPAPAGGAGAGGGQRQRGGGIAIVHDENENIWGMKGLEMNDTGLGILRNTGATVAAGAQGDAGGPFFFTRRYGVLVDSDGGVFQAQDDTIRFQRGSRPDAEYFVIVGPPMKSMAGLALLTGRPPMPPKWTLGFLNSQWVSTEDEWRQLAEIYEKKDIPVSGFIFDFDWKAWGEDDYGEWRWNSTSGEGSSAPNKFPNGASGKFAADMLAKGIHLSGILKPRILLNRVDGKPTKAAEYATEHNLWYPNEVRGNDYFTRRPAANIDFGNPEARKWFWEHLEPAFRAGMTGWWSDEADRDGPNVFNNFQFMNMARSLYDGQRSVSSERVWSINRNYYLGSLRYGYAEWSGDIRTGFQSMAYQRKRMIATLNLGESEWSMDTGGYSGHPTPENYARWMEFGAFVPIFRVHGGSGQKRQPWVYEPVAEEAAKRVMRLRYDLMPYIYSNVRAATETGIGLARPLLWEFPDDERCAEETRGWMFGDALFVSPIVEHGLPTHSFYLPQGQWFDYASGKPVTGGRDMSVAVDSTTWQDVPIYVREGSILATQPATKGNDLSPRTPLLLDVFPAATRAANFVVYDDDGHTYAYEKGEYFRQEMTAKRSGASTEIALGAATGTYKAQFPNYLLRVHQASRSVTSEGASMKEFTSEGAFRSTNEPGWFPGVDKFGPVTEVRLPADAKPRTVKLSSH
jgi:alpha-glucosidase (family GH31 glycosyl hydrolase)